MIVCGDKIGQGENVGRAGCLVRFKGDPTRVLLVTAMHVLVGMNTLPGSPVLADDGTVIGSALFWSSLDGLTTVDAALVWVDPTRVGPNFGDLGPFKGTNLAPSQGDRLRLADGRAATIKDIGVTVTVTASGPDWHETRPYQNQIICPQFTDHGDSGAAAMDDNGKLVGIVVAGGKLDDGTAVTLITPIAAVLEPEIWDKQELELVTVMPDDAVAPVAPAPAATIDWASLARVTDLPLHSRGGKAWRVGPDGIFFDGADQAQRSPGKMVTCPQIVALYGREIADACRAHGVPPELVVMTIAAETGMYMTDGFTGPATFRWEPKLTDYSAGPMQVLSKTAQNLNKKFVLGFEAADFPSFAAKPNPVSGNLAMFKASTSIACGTAMIREGLPQTGTDPILVAARYNAGSLFADPGNPWGLVVTGDHLDRCAQYYGDACATLKQLGR